MEVNQSELEIISREEIEKFCRRYFTRDVVGEDLNVVSFEYTNVSEVPKGFLGKHRFLNVLISRKTRSGDCTQDKIKFFVKSAPQNIPKHMEYCEGFGVFKKEANVCKYLLPRLFDINIGRSRHFAPKCYLAKNNVLVFENVAEKGYRLGSKEDTLLDYDHLLCALKAISELHAASIILEHRTQKRIPDIYGACVEENSYPTDPNNIRSTGFKAATEALSLLLKNIPKYQNSPDLDCILESFQKILEKIFELCKSSTKFRNVLNHGDLWANNLMFRYDKDKKRPLDCYLVDFQLARYAPPILDVMTLLTIPTTSSFRQKHLDDLLVKYYKLLDQNLASHDIFIEEVIPLDEYYASIAEFKLAGLIESCLYSHCTILPENIVASMLQSSDHFDDFITKKRSEICLKAFQASETYRDRLTDMISDLVDNYVLKETTKL